MRQFGDLAAEVADAFDLGRALGPMREVAGGVQARVWRLDTQSGSFAVKQPRRGFEPRADGIDVTFLEAVLDQTGAHAPVPRRARDGAAVAVIDGTGVRVSTWVDLQAPSRRLDPLRVGELLAALHQVRFPLPGDAEVDPWYWEGVGESRWREHVARLDDADAPFVDTLRAEIPHLLELERLLEPPQSPRMCHCDLWEENLLQNVDGRLCVIDWDNCGPADPAHELAMVVFGFGDAEPARMKAIHSGYVAAGGLARLVRPQQLTMVIAQFGHFWELAVDSWLDPEATEDDRARTLDRVHELMSPPLRSADCDALIEAVG